MTTKEPEPGRRGTLRLTFRASAEPWVHGDPRYSDVTVIVNGEPVGTARVLGLDNQALVNDWQNIPAELLQPGGSTTSSSSTSARARTRTG